MDRRTFLRLAGGAVLAPGVLAACGGDDEAAAPDSPAATTTTAPGTTAAGAVTAVVPTTRGKKPVRKATIGFIALTDSASAIMAKELGYFAERDLDVAVVKQASWPALRDALLNGQIDAAHCLYSMPFSVATGIGGAGSTDLRIAMMMNQNGQGITLSNDYKDVPYGDIGAAAEILKGKDAPTLGMTFPGGTHDLWLRYWLKATGADAAKLKINPVPPPQMVQNLSVNNIDGYCVGEPWNAVAVKQGIGFTYLATQDLWLNHPEKALVTTAKYADTQSDTLVDIVGAMLKASKWLDEPVNRASAADTIGVEGYVNAPPAEIVGRLTGKYDLGAGKGTKDFAGEQMQFFRGGEVNFPRRSHAIWAMTQFQRLGYLTEAAPMQKLADELILTDLYVKAAESEGVAIPSDDMKPFEVRLDKVTFDPARPELEVNRP